MQNTDKSLRNLIIYSIYVRNHTPEGTFRAIEPDLRRIRALGTDVIWFMPIHPIGKKGKKGSLGCPYSISDYRAVNPEYGTMEDFRHLVDAIHDLGMKCMIDVVYNHTSHDAVLLIEYPEFYWKKPDGSFGNRFGDWADVYDLDYRNKGLWDYQIQTLKFWATMVDGFRCDVASLVPVEFWKQARKEVAAVRPDCIWLAESVHRTFVAEARKQGLDIWTDAQLYDAFDMEYQYDIHEKFMACFNGKVPYELALHEYIDALNNQETIYPDNYAKLRFVENHDNRRFAELCPDKERRMQWLRFMFFQKGPMLIYGGQEFSCTEVPSLFEREPFERSGEDISSAIADLAQLKKTLPCDAVFEARVLKGNRVECTYTSNGKVCARSEFEL
jgi:glycosidase